MLQKKILLATALILALAGLPVRAAPEAADKASEEKASEKKPDKKGKKKESSKKDEDKPFKEVVKDMERIEGLFSFYRNPDDNRVLIEILPDQLDKDFIYSAKIEQATGERGLYGTIMMGELVFQWRRMGKRVQLVERNLRFRAEPGSPAERAVKNSFSDSILASAKIESAPHPERKSVLADLGEILLKGDLHGLGPHLNEVYKTAYKPDKENSGFVFLKSFPLNSEIGTMVRFQAEEVKQGSVTIPDPRSLSLRFRYSLLAMPANDYRPRLADDRVGYFMDQHMDFTSDDPDTPYVRYIARWNLKKKDPYAEVSEPVEPIVFWLENSIPVEYREWLAEGVLLWNQAFEKIGFKNALAVKQQPDDADWDPADIRYNTIRWFVGYDASFAIGPSHSNPYTGQILDADIGFSEGILRFGARRRYQLYVNPVTRLQELKRESAGIWRGGRPGDRALCHYGQGLAEMASLAYDLLASRDWSSREEREFVRQFTMEVAAHEVGHTLGLRHNFQASTVNRMDQLADDQRSRTVGLAASVMDYNPPIVALKGEKQGDYFPTVVGSYDQWAIAYGYKPIPGANTSEDELFELRMIAERGADPLHPYATDFDTGLDPRSLDPRNTPFDFTDSPLDWYAHEFRLVDELWANMEAKLLKSGESYEVLRRAFDLSWSPYFRGAHVAMKYIGGIHHHRDHVGDPGGRLPYVPVPPAAQRQALDFLARKVWAPDAFQAPANLLKQLQFERFPDFEGSVYWAPRLDYPLHGIVGFIQGEVLTDLYHPTKLARLQDLELVQADRGDRFGMGDLFRGVRSAIWSELDSGSSIHAFRRNLQRAHLDQLVGLLLSPRPDMPEDAVSLARADLSNLQGRIRRVLAGRLDDATEAHLQESVARIGQALEAQVERPSFWP